MSPHVSNRLERSENNTNVRISTLKYVKHHVVVREIPKMPPEGTTGRHDRVGAQSEFCPTLHIVLGSCPFVHQYKLDICPRLVCLEW
jgi:hypothetical protein